MEDNEGESEETPKKKHNKNKKFLTDYPHRLGCLSELGVVWENHNENRWETMFQKLLIHKEEQGTLRFPSEDQCAATGDDELIALQKWVKTQVLSFRYGKKRDPEIVKRLLDIGFDFEVHTTYCIVLLLHYSLGSFSVNIVSLIFISCHISKLSTF